MGKYHKMAAVLAAVSSLALSVPAQAQTPAGEAASLRKLDIMLMVSSLQGAYNTLNADYSARMGAAGAKKALDTISVSMANQYGQGHPWLGCGQLKGLTHDLAGTADRGHLLAVADEVLRDSPPVQVAAR